MFWNIAPHIVIELGLVIAAFYAIITTFGFLGFLAIVAIAFLNGVTFALRFLSN